MKNEMWLIWKQPETRRRYKVGSLTYDAEKYTFQYVNPELDDALEAGFFYFPGFEDLNKKYVNDDLFLNVETRLPNSSRKDYLEILNTYDLNKNASKLEILKATRGRLITDNYEFVPAFDASKIEFDVAGTRYCTNVRKYANLIQVNDKLDLVLDSGNDYDSNAIKVILNKDGKSYHLGYVPRYYSKELSDLLKRGVSYSAMIQGVNFESKLSDEDITVFVKLIFDEVSF